MPHLTITFWCTCMHTYVTHTLQEAILCFSSCSSVTITEGVETASLLKNKTCTILKKVTGIIIWETLKINSKQRSKQNTKKIGQTLESKPNEGFFIKAWGYYCSVRQMAMTLKCGTTSWTAKLDFLQCLPSSCGIHISLGLLGVVFAFILARMISLLLGSSLEWCLVDTE